MSLGNSQRVLGPNLWAGLISVLIGSIVAAFNMALSGSPAVEGRNAFICQKLIYIHSSPQTGSLDCPPSSRSWWSKWMSHIASPYLRRFQSWQIPSGHRMLS